MSARTTTREAAEHSARGKAEEEEKEDDEDEPVERDGGGGGGGNRHQQPLWRFVWAVKSDALPDEDNSSENDSSSSSEESSSEDASSDEDEDGSDEDESEGDEDGGTTRTAIFPRAKSKKKKNVLLFRERKRSEGIIEAKPEARRERSRSLQTTRTRRLKVSRECYSERAISSGGVVDQLCSVVLARSGESDQVCSVFEDGGDDYESRAGTGVSERGESGFGEVGGVRRAFTADIVEEEVNRAFKWLKNQCEKSENGLQPH